MLAPTDAAVFVLMLAAAFAAVFIAMVSGRQRPWKRRLHEVRGVDGTGAPRALAIYAKGEADAIRTARRVLPGFAVLTVVR